MKNTSQYYKDEISQIFRQPTKLMVRLHLNDDIDRSDVTTLYTNAEYFNSQMQETDREEQVGYATLEKDWFKVDGSRYILPDTDAYVYGHFVSKLTSSGSIQFDFNTPVNISGLVFYFVNSYPNELQMTFQYSNDNTATSMILPDTLTYVWGVQEENVIRITIETIVDDSNKRVRINYIDFGLLATFDETNIISSRQDISCDPISSELYQNELTLTVWDINDKFNPEIADSNYSLLSERQSAYIYYGINDYFFRRDILYLQKNYVYENHRLSLTFRDATFYQTAIVDNGFFPSEPIRIDRLLDLLVSYMNISMGFYEIVSSGYVLYNTNNPLPKLSVKEALQLIANAMCAVLYESDNSIVFDMSVFWKTPVSNITKKDELQLPLCDIKDKLRNVIVKTYNYVSGDTEMLLFEKTEHFTENHSETYTINHEMMKDVRVDIIVTSGTMVEQTLDARAFKTECVIESSLGSDETIDYTIKIYGTPPVEIIEEVVLPVNEDGEDCIIENPLVSDKDNAQSIAEWIAGYYSNQKVYEFQMVQDYSLETNDSINFVTATNENAQGKITKLQFNTPGQTGAIQIRRRET